MPSVYLMEGDLQAAAKILMNKGNDKLDMYRNGVVYIQIGLPTYVRE